MHEAIEPLQAIKDLGLGLILFSIGSVFEARHVRAVGVRVFKVVLGESGLTAVLVFIATFVAGMVVAREQGVGTVFSFALLLGLASMATAPAATMFTLSEYEAKGPVTDTILSVTGMNNVVCLVAFHIAFLVLGATGLLGVRDISGTRLVYELVLTIFGSVILGFALGLLVCLAHARLRLAETLLITFATLLVLGAGEHWLFARFGLSYNFLLTSLSMGAVFANVAIDPQRLEQAVRTMGYPILVGFFVIAGFELHLSELKSLGLIGIAYVASRFAGKVIGARLGLRWAGRAGEVHPWFGTALLCQAAVVIGLADFVRKEWTHEWAGPSFAATVLGSVVIFEMCGPLLVKWIAVRSGEVKVMTLLRHPNRAAGGDSIASITWRAFLRMLGMDPSRRTTDGVDLRVRHVMRTNIKCVPASAPFDEVLHMVEQSRYNHFPVIDEDGLLVGVIHFSDIRGLIYNPDLCDLVAAADLANPDTQAVAQDTPLTELLEIFQQGDVGSLPVVEESGEARVLGIVEQRDVLRALHQRQGS